MRVVVTGASGLIGTALAEALRGRGDDVLSLSRGSGSGRWDPVAGTVDLDALDGADAVVHLAGESIGGRWTDAKKRRIRTSRVDGTELLARSAAAAGVPAFLSGSAIGYYGDRGDEVLTESAPGGSGFLADVVAAWERSTIPAEESGLRVVKLRTALVLDRHDGSFPRMLLPFRLGLGGRIGSGRQYWSWITLSDEVRAILHLLDHDVRGPVNLAAPTPMRNEQFVARLGDALRRPSRLPAPEVGLRMLLGSEFAEEVLLASQRVVPAVLEASGFEFEHPTLDTAFQAVLQVPA